MGDTLFKACGKNGVFSCEIRIAVSNLRFSSLGTSLREEVPSLAKSVSIVSPCKQTLVYMREQNVCTRLSHMPI